MAILFNKKPQFRTCSARSDICFVVPVTNAASWFDVYQIYTQRIGIPFFSKFGPKNQNCQFKPKFGTKTNSNMRNSMVMSTFSIFDRKYPFWANLVQKFKIVSLS